MKIVKDRQLEKALNKLPMFTNEELCEIYHNANSWNWDERLGEKPIGFDKMPNISRFERSKYDYSNPICEVITAIVGKKELLRHWHLKGLNKTEKEFNTFWNCQVVQEKLGLVLQPPAFPNDVGRNNS